MFWRFGGYANISTIDTILEKPDFVVEDLLDESDLIQELKQQNSKLIEYLRQDDVLEKLLEYVVAPKLEVVASPAEDDEPEEAKGKRLLSPFSRPRASSRESETDPEEEKEKKRNRYAFVAAEVLSSDTWSIYEALMENQPLIRTFWTFLKRPTPLDPLQASYFTKVNEALFDKKTEEMMPLLKTLPDAVADLLRHVECPMIMDLLLKIIALDRTEGGHGIVEWLYSQDVMPTLLSCLSPANNWVVQTAAGDFIKAIITISANASQNDQQCIGPNEMTRQLVSRPCVEQLIKYMLGGGNPLTVGVGIVIEVIRKNNSDYDPDVGAETHSPPSSRDPIYLGTLLRLFAQHVPDFVHLIMKGPVQRGRIKSTFGNEIEPLGFDRFKTCELMAELLHCSNMGLLNEPGSEEVISARDAERQRLRTEGKLYPHRDDEESQLEDMSARADQSSPEEGRKLEVTNISDDDGFEQVENRDLNEEASPELVSAPVETTAAPATSSFLDKDDDDFVDEPLSSPRLRTSDSAAAQPDFEDPDLVVAPLSPTKRKPADLPEGVNQEDVPDSSSKELPIRDTAHAEPTAQNTPQADQTNIQVHELDTSDDSTSSDDKTAAGTAAPSSIVEETADTSALKDAAVKSQDATVVESQTADVAAPAGDDDDGAKPAPLFSKPAAEADKSDKPLPDLEKPLPAVPTTEESASSTDPQPLLEHDAKAEATATEDQTGSTEEALGAPAVPDAPPVPDAPEAPEVPPRNQPVDTQLVVGDFLKLQFVEYEVVPTILSFFFSYPWNNFLHNVVYDIVQQVFNGPMDRGFNPTLAVSLFESADVTAAIIKGQQASDESQAKTKTRMGYMGHLTLIAEEVVKFTERHPPELLSETVLDRVMDQNWISYVEGALAETRERDNAVLGGVRPEVALGNRGGMSSNGLSSAGLSSLGGSYSGGQGGSNALAEAGLNGGLELQDGSGNNGIGPFAISAGTLMSGFGSSSDEDDDDAEDNDEDVTNEFRAYTDPLNNTSSTSMDPPSIPPPPPPPPPLNIPPSRARLQLAARLAMHQKNASGETGENGEGQRPGSSGSPERLRNPFADDDDEDELDSDDDDEDDLQQDETGLGSTSWGTSNKGAWWRGMVRRRQDEDRASRDDSESDKEDNGDEDDEEFGDFAMPEAEPAPGTNPNERGLLKPLPVHPAGGIQPKIAFSGLWPFGAKENSEKEAPAGADASAAGDVTGESKGAAAEQDTAAAPDKATEQDEKVQQAKEAKRRTSIEDPDDEEVVVQRPTEA